MTTASCTSTLGATVTLGGLARPIPLHRPAWSRAWRAVAEALHHWRMAARERAELRALATLDRRLLHDMGLAERVPPSLGPSWADAERTRW